MQQIQEAKSEPRCYHQKTTVPRPRKEARLRPPAASEREAEFVFLPPLLPLTLAIWNQTIANAAIEHCFAAGQAFSFLGTVAVFRINKLDH